jgi:hypothetical protein
VSHKTAEAEGYPCGRDVFGKVSTKMLSRMAQVGRSVPVYVIIVFRMRSHAEGAISDLLRTTLQQTV